LWHRLYLRPLPHQQGSLAVGSTAGGVLSDVTPKRLRALSPQWNKLQSSGGEQCHLQK